MKSCCTKNRMICRSNHNCHSKTKKGWTIKSRKHPNVYSSSSSVPSVPSSVPSVPSSVPSIKSSSYAIQVLLLVIALNSIQCHAVQSHPNSHPNSHPHINHVQLYKSSNAGVNVNANANANANLLSIRGGSSQDNEKNNINDNDNDNDINNGNDNDIDNGNDNSTNSKTPKYFGSIHSVFQMNMDAKEELIDTDDEYENEYDDSASYDDDDEDNEIEDEEEKKISSSRYSNSHTSNNNNNVSTASSRLIADLDDDDHDENNENEIEEEEESSFESDNEYEEEDEDTSSSSSSLSSSSLSSSSSSSSDKEEGEEKNNLQSMHQQIIQEEWDMIPDTEVENDYESDEQERAKIIAQARAIQEEEREQKRQIERERIRHIQEEERKQRKIERERRREIREQRRQEKELRRQKRNEKKKQQQLELQQQQQQQQNNNQNVKSQDENKKKQRKEDKVVKNTKLQHGDTNVEDPTVQITVATQIDQQSPYISSGWWSTIDKISSLGLSETSDSLKLSKQLHTIRKKAAYATGLHGIISGKGREEYDKNKKKDKTESKEEDHVKDQQRLAAIENARKRVVAATNKNDISLNQDVDRPIPRWRRPFSRRRRVVDSDSSILNDGNELNKSADLNVNSQQKKNERINLDSSTATSASASIPASKLNANINANANTNTLPPIVPPVSTKRTQEEQSFMEQFEAGERKRAEHVKEIDHQINEGKKRILELQCQKDELQRRPNPLYNYTNTKEDSYTSARTFNFPTDELVSEYIEELQSNGRLQKMNHTQLWRSDTEKIDEDDNEDIGDDLLTPSGDVRKLYEHNNNKRRNHNNHRNGANHGGGGSWLLRQSLGMGGSLGEKIGVGIEDAAYKGVCAVVMSILAKSLSILHGVNVMTHSDIRLFVESTPDLPPVPKSIYSAPGSDYAREAIGKAIRKGSKKKKKRRQKPYHYGSHTGDDAFVQRDAVVETLISHCQISAPLLKLFPAEWQRALLGNIITLIAAVISDFLDGVQFQILGHQLSFAFKPITEADMIQHIGVGGFRFNHRRAKPEEFEATVRATADDVSKSLAFLDRWHQRALGGDLLKAQIGNLIARVVLTLVDEVLHSARMDLWSAQVGGPRIVAGLEYRIEK